MKLPFTWNELSPEDKEFLSRIEASAVWNFIETLPPDERAPFDGDFYAPSGADFMREYGGQLRAYLKEHPYGDETANLPKRVEKELEYWEKHGDEGDIPGLLQFLKENMADDEAEDEPPTFSPLVITAKRNAVEEAKAKSIDELKAKETELRVARARIDALIDENLKAQDIRRELDELKAQGDRIEAKADEMGRRQLTRAHYDLVNDIHTTRAAGGGRRKERDLDDAQVKAVLADLKAYTRKSFREHCDHIVRTMKPGQYQNPYMAAKDLASAVRRYCGKHGIALEYHTTRRGKWSAKS